MLYETTPLSACDEIDLQVYVGKIKYIIINWNIKDVGNRRKTIKKEINFKLFGTYVTGKNGIAEEESSHLASGNSCFYSVYRDW